MAGRICVFHSNCHDGVAALWCVDRRFPGIEQYPGVYDQPPELERFRDKDVIFVDFSWKRGPMLEVAKAARSVLVLDHHKTAQAELATSASIHGQANFYDMSKTDLKGGIGGLIVGGIELDNWNYNNALANTLQDTIEIGCPWVQVFFDMERSGAGLAWDFFFPNETRPTFIDLVEDRDIWRFKHPNTKAFHAGNSSEALTLKARKDLYDELARENVPRATMEIVQNGSAILAYHEKLVDDVVAKRFKVRLGRGFRRLKTNEVVQDGDIMGTAWFRDVSGEVPINPKQIGSEWVGHAVIDVALNLNNSTLFRLEKAWDVFAVSCPLLALTSDLGERLCEFGLFGLNYWWEPERKVWQFSLRSRDDFDVSEVAKCFGGGGHQQASGFSVPSLDGVLTIL